MRKNVSSQFVCAQLVNSSSGAAVTSGTTTVYVLGDGGIQATGSGSVAHEGNGMWSYAPTQAETNYDHVAFTFANSSAISVCVNVFPVSFDYTDGVRIGLTALPNAAADAAGGLPVSDAGGLDLDATIGAMVYTVANQLDVNVIGISGSNTASDNVELVFDTDFATAYNTVTNQWNVTISGTPDVNAIQISGSTAAANNLETIFDTNYATVYNATSNKLDVVADATKISGDATTADNVQTIFGTNYATVYDATNNKLDVLADMIKISGDATSADNLEESTNGIVAGAATATTLSTTQMSTNLAEGTDDHYIGRTVVWLENSALHGQASLITDYAGSGGTLTFETVTEAPASGDKFVII